MSKYVFDSTDMFRLYLWYTSDLINCFRIYYSQQHVYPKDKGANLFSPVHLEESTNEWKSGIFIFLYLRRTYRVAADNKE